MRRLNEADNEFEYYLPSESEWEYAASGVDSGDSAASDVFAWFGANSGGRTHPVGEKAANTFGLYDMVGNVAEWVQDIFSADYNGLPTDGSANEHIGNTAYRVFRGGSFQDEESVATVRARTADAPSAGYRYNGLRIVARIK
jgi:formylglycine-generating enzyme required for sulfatase activity